MKIVCIGGGPAGLYFALLMKKADPNHDITVVERNRPYDTFGWGVVFSDQTLQNLAGADETSKREIIDSLAHWDDIDVHFKGRVIRSGGHGFCGIERKHLLNILQHRCEVLGVKLVFETVVECLDAYADADLIIASDGINSRIREMHADHFRPDIDLRSNKFVWLGTSRIFDAFTFAFKETEWGWFQAHAYRFNDTMSTFIVETPESVWRAAGIEEMSKEEGIGFCEDLFAEELAGHSLISNADHLRGSAIWINFPRVLTQTWVKDNLVLMGDAAHTAHYSIGSGTKLALEDAIALAEKVQATPEDVPGALRRYEAERKVEVLKIQSAARNSTEWFENVERYARLPAEQFAYSLLTRSQRVSHENLRLRDRKWLEGYEGRLADAAARAVQADGAEPAATELSTPAPVPAATTATPPMLTPFRLRDMVLKNRVVVSPMAQYSARKGMPTDWHLVHLGSRAVGGAGLIFAEMTCISPEGRITPGCPGLWSRDQMLAWKRIVDFVHHNSDAKIALQLGHAGPKGSTKLGWDGMDQPLDAEDSEENWPLFAPSAMAWDQDNQVPKAMDRADMDKVVADFERATRFAVEAGFDLLELHAAHGYLISAFISPLTNKREDAYGGALENRLRFPLEVFDAMRAIWPDEKPMSVRISATDWHPDGVTPEEAVEIARAFKAHGVDLLDVSAGQTSVAAKPVYGRMFQTPFADRIRNEVGVATMAVGNIFETDHANGIIAAGRADLTALARPHLADPYWTLHAAAELGDESAAWPNQYLTGRGQYLRNLQKAKDAESVGQV